MIAVIIATAIMLAAALVGCFKPGEQEGIVKYNNSQDGGQSAQKEKKT